MVKRAVIEADFSTFRPVAGRKVLQLVFEVPIENAEKVMSVLGYPVPGQSKWCGIAPLAMEADKASAPSEPPPSKPKRKFDELPYSQQAALRCQDASFGEYSGSITPEDCVRYVYAMTGVSSRAELDKPENAEYREAWEGIERGYQAWVTDKIYRGAHHG